MTLPPDDTEIHAYVDGLLAPDRVREIESWLERHPQQAAELHAWRQDAQQLRTEMAAELRRLPAATLPDPARVRRSQASRRRTRLALAASLLIGLGTGGIGGWELRSAATPRTEPPMGDALQAYRLFVQQVPMNADIIETHPGELRNWLEARFGARHPQLPELAGSGFQAVGGRLLATAEGPAAMVVYRNDRGDAISYYIRPPGAGHGRLPRGERRQEDLLAQYGSRDGYNIALVGPAQGDFARLTREAMDSLI